ncbi:hypothetical protein MMC07_002931 [Pseudocyphellaria aurata]|nr:hypothetical protein [Pseudocyphellaria aurata]
MKDLFPPPPMVVKATRPFADALALRTLPLHVHEILPAFCFYHFTNTVLAPRLSSSLFPTTYAHLPARTKTSWHAHVVSLVQSCVINTAALSVIFMDSERMQMDAMQRVWGYTGATGMVQALSTGYFLWDLMTGILDWDVHGWGVVAHAASALAVSSLGFRPFVNYYGLNFVLYELSTPFLNIHWFMDKLGMTGSKAQLINGVALIVTFGGSRLVWGTYQSVKMYQDVWRALKIPGELPVPPWLALSYLASTTVLSVLNIYWFGRMIKTIRSRFEKPNRKTSRKEQ